LYHSSILPLFCRFVKPAAKIFRRRSEGAAEGGVWGEFRRVRAEAKPRRPARSEQSPAKKFSFPLKRKNPARAKSKNVKKTFLRAGERQRAAAGQSGQLLSK